MAITICVGNYKGGVGKTKNNILNAYQLAKKGYKTLVVDLDPQGNATTVLLRTKKLHSEEIFSFDKTLMTAVRENDITNIETEIIENLYLLPSYIDFANYTTFLDKLYGVVEEGDENYFEITQQKITHFDNLLNPLKENYDYIFIDVPPTKSYITDSAVMASNYVLIVLQTQELSLDGAIQYLGDLQKLSNIHNGNFEICGVLPVLMDNNASLDQFVLENAGEAFGEENIFNNKIPNMARLKRFDNTGITEFDRHDLKVMELYNLVSDELIERINFFEGV
ncbi:ATPase [Carnobacterium maltaromaticum]|jgi:cellulose biosynthesis protein BcsQ|uniref:ParA family protein n=1 Tax=Carnobacterium TaxID=2747 RepID=UPI000E734F24|nr:ParA family protein [Carnobacterium maltaromaticum]AOA04207.1 ATPase [Carnobacterium maltaromaticum]MDT1946556.1 AAA family ATPase [Carnobacterium maltaromaticum]MDT2000941.1 AAA family ATPase [Carnobacterium maltaromaticum]MDW5525160.1 ParA family protein [Carnobacterium maltaromaticum]TFJ25642.1 ATPase [Carnobacterium maltaromaticum]